MIEGSVAGETTLVMVPLSILHGKQSNRLHQTHVNSINNSIYSDL